MSKRNAPAAAQCDRAINELAKLFALYGLNADAAQNAAIKHIGRASTEIGQTLAALR